MLGPALEGRATGIGAAGRDGAPVSPTVASSGIRRGAVAGARSGICRGAAGGAGAAVVGATGDSSAPRRVSSASARSRSAAGDPRRHAKTPATSTAMATTMASSMGKGWGTGASLVPVATASAKPTTRRFGRSRRVFRRDLGGEFRNGGDASPSRGLSHGRIARGTRRDRAGGLARILPRSRLDPTQRCGARHERPAAGVRSEEIARLR